MDVTAAAAPWTPSFLYAFAAMLPTVLIWRSPRCAMYVAADPAAGWSAASGTEVGLRL